MMPQGLQSIARQNSIFIMQPITCEACRQPTPAHDVVNYGSEQGGLRQLCGRCFNECAAEHLGLEDFEHVQLEPIRMVDARGVSHEFQFRTRLFGPGLAIDALELVDGSPGGYEFQVIGEHDDDPLALLGKLVAKMRRALSLTHLEESELGPQVNNRMVVRGRVDCDLDAPGHTPSVVIDGREFTWEAFGQMVATFEGWQFKLEFKDRSEEV